MASNKKGGGAGSRVVTERGVRVGDRAKVVNPRAVSQIGQTLGNKAATGGGKTVKPAETFYGGRQPAGGPGGVPLGNAVALNVGGGGPGKGRDFVSKSGSNCVSGPVAGSPRPAGRDILNDYGPDSANVRGRR
jgi:hypothetical protein